MAVRQGHRGRRLSGPSILGSISTLRLLEIGANSRLTPPEPNGLTSRSERCGLSRMSRPTATPETPCARPCMSHPSSLHAQACNEQVSSAGCQSMEGDGIPAHCHRHKVAPGTSIRPLTSAHSRQDPCAGAMSPSCTVEIGWLVWPCWAAGSRCHLGHRPHIRRHPEPCALVVVRGVRRRRNTSAVRMLPPGPNKTATYHA
jgi:hypothetical protein